MVGWHQLNGHESDQALGVGDGQGSLACCSSWGCKEWDTIEQLNRLIDIQPCNLNVAIGETEMVLECNYAK